MDLVGSTEFKSSDQVEGSNLYPDWVVAFQDFYEEFPRVLTRNYADTKSGMKGEQQVPNGVPKIWKTIGDEIVFSVRVSSLRHLACCITAFLAALDEYGNTLESVGRPLDVKGSGWLAVFPSENLSLKLQRAPKGDEDLPDEAIEAAADNAPFEFDFLGKSIDAGFRIAKNSTAARFSTSVELSLLLARATLQNMFSGKFTYHGQEIFKGVLKNQAYPVVSIDTERNAEKRNIRARERILTQEQEAPPLALQDFLEAFLKFHRLEIPEIRNETSDPGTPAPKSYQRYREAWDQRFKEISEKAKSVTASEEVKNQSGNESMPPTISDFVRLMADLSRNIERSAREIRNTVILDNPKEPPADDE